MTFLAIFCNTTAKPLDKPSKTWYYSFILISMK